MASLKVLRNRISSVKATQKITKAMQMVAAAKLRRAQEAAEAGRPYAARMDRVLANLGEKLSDNKDASPLLVGTGSEDVHLLLVATAERGLCGGFNSNIAKLASKHAHQLIADGRSVKILCVGRKGSDALRSRHGSRIIDLIDLRSVKNVSFENANEISKRVLTMFNNGEFDVCTLFYSEFKNIMDQRPTAQQLIPAKLPKLEASDEVKVSTSVAAYEYEPEEDEILKSLLPLNVGTQIFRALLENAASEQGARMSAMDNATRNAGEMIENLTLVYNRTRQAQITSDLIEIISGAEAV